MPGAFEESPEFDHDALRTAEEIQRCGEDALLWLEALAGSEKPREVDIHLVRDIHARWFDTTFPFDAGRERAELVLNRKGTTVAVDAILPGVAGACGNWTWRRRNVAPDDEEALVSFIVSEANTVTVAVYDVHPFIDGNTRTTWYLRNYLLMLDDLRPLVDLRDEKAYGDAWWDATALDHEALDRVVLEELTAQDR